MDYHQVVEDIFSLPRFTKKNTPEHTAELLNRLGRPERLMKIIHVAGSNGKGSVCAFLSNILVSGKKRTGLFTSPHLIEINERFQIDNEPVSNEEFLVAYQIVQNEITKMLAEGLPHPTFFEMVFIIGLVIFERAEVEYLILETGLGGRLDATNLVIQKMLTIITAISLEHTEILGDTIEQIAVEKAGIMRPNVPVIYDANDKKVAEVIKSQATKVGATAIPFTNSLYEIFRKNEKSIDFSLDFGYYEHTKVRIPSIAEYQVRNSVMALMAAESLDCVSELPIQVRVQAIAQTHWQGRLEMVLSGVVLEGAHNVHGIQEFAHAVRNLSKNCVLLFAAMAEKDYLQMVQIICEEVRPRAVIVTEVSGGRAVPAATLGATFTKYTKVPIIIQPAVEKAFQTGMEQRGEDNLFCVGSLYLIGALKRIIKERY